MSRQLSIIVINYGKSYLVVNFLRSARNSADSSLIKEVIIVDNGYPLKGDSRDVVSPSSFPFGIKFAQNPESSYASGVNRGGAMASGDYLIISNNDVELLPDSSLRPLLDCLKKDSRIGVVGPQLVYPDGTWQQSYGQFPSLKTEVMTLMMLDSIGHAISMLAFRHNWLPERLREVDYIGAFMVTRRLWFEKMGGFNEDYSFYGEDVDFCWRAWNNGWKVVLVPSTRVMHVRGASSTVDALGAYTLLRIKTRRKLVEDHFGPRQAKRCGQYARAALYERSLLYGLAAKVIRAPRCQERARQARICYQAFREAYKSGRY